jgi:hypothetical protein
MYPLDITGYFSVIAIFSALRTITGRVPVYGIPKNTHKKPTIVEGQEGGARRTHSMS